MKYKNALLMAMLLVFGNFVEAACLDKVKNPKTIQAVENSAKPLLDPTNEKVVPPGLPEGKFPVRTQKVVATIQKQALVFIFFKENSGDDGFMAPYSFEIKTGKLKPINVPDLGNNDSRFWRAKEQVLSRCDSPAINVTYDACLACGAGANLKGKFAFSSDQWAFHPDEGNAKKLESD